MRRELYLSILMDRGSGGPLLVASPFGGEKDVWMGLKKESFFVCVCFVRN